MDAFKVNCKRKIYPDGTVRQVSTDFPIFVLKDKREQERRDRLLQEIISKPQDLTNDSRDDSVKRAKEAIYDIAALNEFRWFVTWTLDGEKVNRYDKEEVKKKLCSFLRNMHNRHGMKYLIVPEYHKDGAIHMHGLVDGDIQMLDSGHQDKKGHTIFNMPQWKLGYSTAMELYGDSRHVAAYITKYVEKDFQKIFGKFYYSSCGLSRKPSVEYTFIDYDKINSPEFRRVIGYKYTCYNAFEDDIDDE